MKKTFTRRVLIYTLAAVLILAVNGLALMAATPEPIAVYNFSDSNPAKAAIGTDLKVYGLDGIENAGLAVLVDGPYEGTKALKFNANYYLATGNSDFTDSLTDFTFTYWAKRTDGVMSGIALGNGFFGPAHPGFFTRHSAGNDSRISFGAAAGGAETWNGDMFEFAHGVDWTLYVITGRLTGDDPNLYFYAINLSDISDDISFDDEENSVIYSHSRELALELNTLNNPNAPFIIGGSYSDAGSIANDGDNVPFTGLISDVRFYNQFIDADQVIELIINMEDTDTDVVSDVVSDVDSGNTPAPGDPFSIGLIIFAAIGLGGIGISRKIRR